MEISSILMGYQPYVRITYIQIFLAVKEFQKTYFDLGYPVGNLTKVTWNVEKPLGCFWQDILPWICFWSGNVAAAAGLGEIEFVEVTAAVEIELIGGACCCCKGKIRSISISLSKYSLGSPFTKMVKKFEQRHSNKFKLGKIEFVGVTAAVEIELIGGADKYIVIKIW